ncbi:MAG: indolepyruvate oxidoreductase subunit beta [Kiritimatiellae bacterium]|nr:indolepyruvate oxidoreductase subunit beta [Kiritimatiellia bacterium]MDD4735169.1 indolepyruvate oxidoreductase subunit beta [Kiritimatiellia bacterium]
MKCDIVLAGVGGQGILSIAAVLGRAALEQGLHIKQAEVHGMAQRGGAVQSHFRMSAEAVASDVIPFGQADLILSMEPMEALRYLPWLKKEGWVVSNNQPVDNIAAYPDLTSVHAALQALPHHLLFDGVSVATEYGSSRALNMAMLGAASPFVPLAVEVVEQSIREQFAHKDGQVIQANLDVFRAARALALQNMPQTA